MKQSLENEEARTYLLQVLKPGDTVYTLLRHVSRSGMMRRISPIVFRDGKPIDLSWQIARLGLWPRIYPHEGLVVRGCGEDMGFRVVYELSKAIFDKGNGFSPDGSPRSDSGYALKQKWL